MRHLGVRRIGLMLSAFVYVLILGCGGGGSNDSDVFETVEPTPVHLTLQPSWRAGEAIDLEMVIETELRDAERDFGKETTRKSILIEFLSDESSEEQLVRWTTYFREPELSSSLPLALEPEMIEFYLDQSGTITRMPMWQSYRSTIEQAFEELQEAGLEDEYTAEVMDLIAIVGNNMLKTLESESDIIISLTPDAATYFSKWYTGYSQGKPFDISSPSLVPGATSTKSKGTLTLNGFDPATGRGVIDFAQTEKFNGPFADAYASVFEGVVAQTDEMQDIFDSEVKGDFSVKSTITANFNSGFIESIITVSDSEMYAGDVLFSGGTTVTSLTASPHLDN